MSDPASQLVHRARQGDHAAAGQLIDLLHAPIYAYLRQHGHAPSDAEDSTQQFFAELLADETLQAACPAHGRLRTFLLAALRRSLADQTRYRRRQKRGGGVPPISLECARAEDLYFAEPVDTRDPEKLYLSAWARSLMDLARERDSLPPADLSGRGFDRRDDRRLFHDPSKQRRARLSGPARGPLAGCC